MVAEDLTESLEKFWGDSFELWLDATGASLIECHNREASFGATTGLERVNSFDSSSFPLPYP